MKEKKKKLSTEFYNYKKEEIKRIDKKRSRKKDDDLSEIEGDLLKEIKKN